MRTDTPDDTPGRAYATSPNRIVALQLRRAPRNVSEGGPSVRRMRHSKYTQEILEDAVASSFSVAGVLRYLGIPGSRGMHAHISRRIKHYRIDTSHFLGSGHLRGTVSSRRLPAARSLVLNEPGSARVESRLLRRALLEIGSPYGCAVCSLAGELQGLPLVLHVDHINGNHLDSRCDNLRFLCPKLPHADRQLGRHEQDGSQPSIASRDRWTRFGRGASPLRAGATTRVLGCSSQRKWWNWQTPGV